MENNKQVITHELIMSRLKETYFNRHSAVAIPVAIFLILVGYLIHRIQSTSNEQDPFIPLWAYILFAVVITAIYALWEYRKYTQIKSKNYEIVTDHLQKTYNPFFEPLKYRHLPDHTRFFQFRKYGKCPAYNWSINKNRSKVEEEMHYNYHNAKVGDQFYLVILGKRIIQVYNAQQYCLPDGQ